MKTRTKGPLWRKGDAGFSAVTTSALFNRRLPDRRPAAVLRAADAADVAAGVRLAGQEGWRIAIRSGGHSLPAWSVREDTLLIDLALFTGMAYDATTGIVAVGPAVRGGTDLDPYLAGHGRFFPCGHAPTVALGGFLLQGGMGWNCRGWGWAAEFIESLDVVTASGELIRCSETDNPDMFWAARGSGPGFFGVVTEFRLRTRPRPRHLTRDTYVYPMELGTEVLDWFCGMRHQPPSSVELSATAFTPEGSASPVLLVSGVSFGGEPSALAALGTCPVAAKASTVRTAEPVDMRVLHEELDRANPEGHRWVADNAFLQGTAADVVAALEPALRALPTRKTFAVLGDLTPMASRPAPDTAVSLQTDLYFGAYGISGAPDEDARCRRWLDNAMERLSPYSAGCYLGDSDFTVRPDRVMTDAAWSRFQSIRAVRDPQELFVGYLGEPTQ